MRFASLGSGSRGNATLIEEGSTCVLVDSGFSVRELVRRLGRLGRRAEDLDAILVTHEHGDHIGGVAPLARRYGIPVWMTPGTLAAHALGEVPHLQCFSAHQPFTIGALQVQPFPVPHDAREPCQFVFDNGQRRLGLLTDTGSDTPHIRQSLEGCDALLLECNHDPQMLASGPYPPVLQARVGGRYGHLSNNQAAAILQSLHCGTLQHVVAAHISEKNNTVEMARGALSAALGCEPHWIGVAEQESGLDWRAVS